MPKKSITQAELKELLDYNLETGVLTWIKARKCGGKDGARAGYIHRRGYRYLEIYGQHWAAHRLIWLWWYGVLPDCSIDHINGVFDDNRLCNLRLAVNNGYDQKQNNARYKNNTTGYAGVSYSKKKGKYMARIQSFGVSYFLGEFLTPEEAYAAYCAKKKELHLFSPEPRD